jgi:hypothetical protein
MSDHQGNIPPDDAAEELLDRIIQKTQRLTLFDKQPQDKANRSLDAAVRFHGKSTNFNLVLATREMKMMYLLESKGAAADTVNNEVGHAAYGPDHHAQALEGGSRRKEYWRSLDVSIHFCPRQRCSPLLVVILSFFRGTFEFPAILCVSSGNSSTKENSYHQKPSRSFFKTGHRQIW